MLMGNQSVLLCLSAAGRLSALDRVRSERFHCRLSFAMVTSQDLAVLGLETTQESPH